jgi:frataxin-like iron-binding protein CyaY
MVSLLPFDDLDAPGYHHVQWSSPLSGPKRFEYDDKDGLWYATKDGVNLGYALSEEIHHFYPTIDRLDLDV